MDNTETPYFQNAFTSSSRKIHTPSVFAKSSLLYLQEVGALTALRPHTSARADLASYLFFVVTGGKGQLVYKGKPYALETGDCVFIDCKEGYCQQSSGHRDAAGGYDELWSLAWVHFSGGSMPSIYTKYRERGGKPVFRCAAPERYAALVRSIFSIASADSYVCDMQIAGKLTELLTFLMEDAWDKAEASGRQRGAGHPAPKRKLVKQVKDAIDENYAEPLTLHTLADRFYINKEYLSKIFKETYGYPVNGYIANVRIGKAKELLRFTDQTVEEIAASVGFADVNYFSRVFRRVEGVSPRQYRQSW